MPMTAERIASLYDQHGPEVLRYLARRTFDPEVAVDLLAETFTKAIVQRRQFRGVSDEEAVAWIYSIARHLLIDNLRRIQVERSALEREGRQRRTLFDDEYERIERLLDLRDIRDAVAVALKDLSDAHRQVLQLRVIEECSYGELAAAIGTSEQTARARLSRALQALRAAPTMIRLQEELDRA